MEFKALIQKVATLDLWPHCHPLCHPPPFSIAMEMNSWAKKLEQAKSKAFHRAPKRKMNETHSSLSKGPRKQARGRASKGERQPEIEKVTSCRKLCDLKKKSTGGVRQHSSLAKTTDSTKKDADLGSRGGFISPFPRQNFIGKDYQEKDRNLRGEGRNAWKEISVKVWRTDYSWKGKKYN